MNQLSDIEKYTVGIYSEKNKELKLFGSGILVLYKEIYLLLSAHHVFDREEEQIEIENDPDEEGIPQDNFESFLCRDITGSFFYIDNYYQAQVYTSTCDTNKKEIVFNEDTEYGICFLEKPMVQYFLESGKIFYEISEINHIPLIKPGEKVILGGFPKYAQKENVEIFRSYLGKFPLNNIYSLNGLIRILFENDHAFCIEQNDYVKIKKPEGIEGMSGGGVWMEKEGTYIPVGIILRQEEDFIEMYPISSIIK